MRLQIHMQSDTWVLELGKWIHTKWKLSFISSRNSIQVQEVSCEYKCAFDSKCTTLGVVLNGECRTLGTVKPYNYVHIYISSVGDVELIKQTFTFRNRHSHALLYATTSDNENDKRRMLIVHAYFHCIRYGHRHAFFFCLFDCCLNL